ncbi:Rz1-like lysis system protein LysC [Serratia proteamaculans]
MLSGCSATPLTLAACPADMMPQHLLAPCPTPVFTVETWGDYPDYVARLQLALKKCNTDKTTVARLLRPEINIDPGQ